MLSMFWKSDLLRHLLCSINGSHNKLYNSIVIKYVKLTSPQSQICTPIIFSYNLIDQSTCIAQIQQLATLLYDVECIPLKEKDIHVLGSRAPGSVMTQSLRPRQFSHHHHLPQVMDIEPAAHNINRAINNLFLKLLSVSSPSGTYFFLLIFY